MDSCKDGEGQNDATANELKDRKLLIKDQDIECIRVKNLQVHEHAYGRRVYALIHACGHYLSDKVAEAGSKDFNPGNCAFELEHRLCIRSTHLDQEPNGTDDEANDAQIDLDDAEMEGFETASHYCTRCEKHYDATG